MGSRLAAQDEPWRAFADAFVAPEGRVVDALQGGISHSEGQGYAMVLATAAGDEARFEAMRAWTETHLAVRRDALLAWRWAPGQAEAERDYNNASDGDLFYAWALLRGARLWARPDLADRAATVAEALVAICLAPDPRGSGELIMPAAERFGTGDALVLNPSYWMPRAMNDLAAAFDLPRLALAAESGTALLAEVAEAGPVPDWIAVTPAGWAPSPEHPPVSGFEAIRVPLWLVWSDRAGHPAVGRALEARDGDGVFVIRRLEPGWDAERVEAPGFAAVLGLAACAVGAEGGVLPAYASGQAYYPAVLHLLAQVAARETGRRCA